MEAVATLPENTMHPNDQNEELLQDIGNRFVMFPIRYNAIWQMYKKAESAFWTAEEVDLSKDLSDWDKLNENEQFYIKQILAFFAASDGIVNENLGVRFMNDIKVPEAKSFYGFQIAMENIHCVTGDTEILTRTGYSTICHLANKVVDVWNGEDFSSVMVMQTSPAAEVMRVTLSNGMQLDCTTDHKWLIEESEERVFTKNLVPGMTIRPFEYPMESCHEQDLFTNPKNHGMMCGSMDPLQNETYNPSHFNCRARLFVPVNHGIDTKIQWLSGLFTHASVNMDDMDRIVCVKHDNREVLKHVQLLLTTMRVFSSMAKAEDGSDAYSLWLDSTNAKKLLNYGVIIQSHDATLHMIKSLVSVPDRPFIIQIASVEALPGLVPTYCFDEPIRHTGIFNGVLTGQSEMYSLLIDSYIKDNAEKHHLFNAINTIPCIKKKAEWAMRWISDKDACFAKRLVAFACVEGIFFSGAFCSIFWLKERGVMPGLTTSNEFISRDESLHTEFAVLLYSLLQNKLDQETIHAIITEAVTIEDEFINESIPCAMLGMNSQLMSQYIKFVADRLIVQLGYEKVYNVTNPFHFMDRISLETKTNFFEQRVAEYSRARIGDEKAGYEFGTDEDF
jgi:ribonucleotide reductase beta subunit family protein with ferritin-like domain